MRLDRKRQIWAVLKIESDGYSEWKKNSMTLPYWQVFVTKKKIKKKTKKKKNVTIEKVMWGKKD